QGGEGAAAYSPIEVRRQSDQLVHLVDRERPLLGELLKASHTLERGLRASVTERGQQSQERSGRCQYPSSSRQVTLHSSPSLSSDHSPRRDHLRGSSLCNFPAAT